MRNIITYIGLIAVLLSFAIVTSSGTAGAATATIIKVNSVIDAVAANPGSGVCQTKPSNKVCTLRAAVQVANAASGPVTIVLPLGTFRLTIPGRGEDNAATGDLDLKGNITITGVGIGSILNGNNLDRVLQILAGANVTIKGVLIRSGNPGAGDGGAIKVDSGATLNLYKVTLSQNTAVNGGGIDVGASSTVTIQNSKFSLNKASAGGALHSLGAVTIRSSTVSGNTGGGLRSEGGSLTLVNVNVLSNTGNYGIYNSASGLSVTGGAISGNQGGVFNRDNSGTATLANLKITGNAGSGVYNISVSGSAHISISGSTITLNKTSLGGGVYNNGLSATADIATTVIKQNGATQEGGGIYNLGVLNLNRTAVVQNTADDGAGILNGEGATLTAMNDTISNNISSGNGGGINNGGTATLTYVTINGNTAAFGNAVFVDTSTLTLVNTILASKLPANNCDFNLPASLTSLGHNLENGNLCGLTSTGDLVNTSPKLGPLQNNGGHTLSNALLTGSPAINAGDNSYLPATDQRGAPRPFKSIVDIGAYEYGALVP